MVVAIGELQMYAQREKDQHTPSTMVKKALDWQLKEKKENETLFIKGDLTDYNDWTIMNKNFK